MTDRPTDAEIDDLWRHSVARHDTTQLFVRDFARAVLAKWGGQPAPAASPPCGECDGTGMVASSQAHFRCPACSANVQSDEAIIQQCMDALECAGAYTALIDDYSLAAIQEAYKATRARLASKRRGITNGASKC